MSNRMYTLPTQLPTVLPIEAIQDECSNMKTFFFKHAIDFKPGQFMMVWDPRKDEKPFTVSYWSETRFGITVEKKGTFTTALFEKKVNDKLGFRGPFGNGFSIDSSQKVCIVGGGCGIAPLAPLMDVLPFAHCILGAQNKSRVLFAKRFPNAVFVTDDGSFGAKGFVTEYLEKHLKEASVDKVYACGPERMLVKVVEICNQYSIPFEISLERYMKCGFGVCGQCVCGKKRVCAEGPVFNQTDLSAISDFGVSHRLKTGQSLSIHSQTH